MISEKTIQTRCADRKHLFRHNAFTLAEMLLVLVLIALLTSGVAVSLRQRLDAYALKTASQGLAEAIRFAATEAYRRGQPYRVVFLDKKSYRVEKREGPDFVPESAGPGRTAWLAGEVRIVSIAGPDGQLVQPTPSCLVFDQSTEIFSGQICLQGQSNRQIRIDVNGLSGQVGLRE